MLKSKNQFRELAKPIIVRIGGQEHQAIPMEFQTGSLGWHVAANLTLALPDGTNVPCYMSMNMTVPGSKNLPQSHTKAVAVQTTPTPKISNCPKCQSSDIAPQAQVGNQIVVYCNSCRSNFNVKV